MLLASACFCSLGGPLSLQTLKNDLSNIPAAGLAEGSSVLILEWGSCLNLFWEAIDTHGGVLPLNTCVPLSVTGRQYADTVMFHSVIELYRSLDAQFMLAVRFLKIRLSTKLSPLSSSAECATRPHTLIPRGDDITQRAKCVSLSARVNDFWFTVTVEPPTHGVSHRASRCVTLCVGQVWVNESVIRLNTSHGPMTAPAGGRLEHEQRWIN